jgi:hypothetical protein
MHTIIFILSIVFLIAGALFFALAVNRNTETKQMNMRQEELSASLAKREEACREAMRKNGQTSLELAKKEGAFDLECKVIEVVYLESTEDRAKYPSDAKRLAVIKSRLAHNLGYKILAEFPNPEVDPAGTVYSYTFRVKEEK